MTDDLADGDTDDYDKHQAHSFFRVINMLQNISGYNMVSHVVTSDSSQAECEG